MQRRAALLSAAADSRLGPYLCPTGSGAGTAGEAKEIEVTREPLEVVDSSGLTDANWADINRLKRTYEEGGQAALSKAMAELSEDPIRYMAVIGAFFPDIVREAIKDSLAECGLTDEDIREMVRKLESPARDQ
jgi:hypothetical protein